MAINKNHEFEELDGIKCGIVEKNVSKDRASFLKNLLEYNRLQVVIVPTPVKAAPKAAEPAVEAPVIDEENKTFTVGVTDYTFNTINAIFGRQLKTPEGNIVTLAYWQQKEAVSQDDIPYFEV